MIAYGTMNGTKLFKAETPEENTTDMIKARIHNQIQGRLADFYSRQIRSVTWRMLQKKPEERPTASGLLEEDFFKTIAANPAAVKPEGLEQSLS